MNKIIFKSINKMTVTTIMSMEYDIAENGLVEI